MGNFENEINNVLRDKGYDKHYVPLDEFSKIIEKNHLYAENKILIYKWLGLILLIIIGVLGVTLPLMASLKDTVSWKDIALQTSSVILAVATIFNSMFKPNERFTKACHIGMAISTFKVNFLLSLERAHTVDDVYLSKFVQDRLKEFEQYQVALIELFMPSEPKHDDGKKTTRSGK